MTTFTLPLPYGRRLPLSANQARSTTHFRTQHKVKLGVHADIATIAAAHKVPALAGADLLLTWQLPNRVRRDADSLSWLLKACADALVVAGVLPDDNWRHVQDMTMRVLPPVKDMEGEMTLTITERDVTEDVA